MGEVKNAFIKSKMNKDLDARLIPSGEYRNAVNAQVSKSDSADVGALENVLGNIELLDFEAITGISDLTCVGFLSDDSTSKMYLFFTDYTDPTPLLNTYNPNSNNFIFQYNTSNDTYKLLVEGSFLNLSKTNIIYGVNLIEDLLFWTDNRNQPRKINIQTANELGLTYYTTEDQISVAKYNPYQAMEMYAVSEKSNQAIPQYETTMKDVVSTSLPNGGSGLFTSALANVIVLNGFKGQIVVANSEYGALGASISYIDGNGDIINIPDLTVSTAIFTEVSNTWDITMVGSGTLPAFSVGQEIILNPNPYYNSGFAGNENYLEDKFVRFGYRFRFDDGEYSIFSTFTQAAFIPKQDGYFMYVKEDGVDEVDNLADAYRSTIVSFLENKVNDIKLRIPLPFNNYEIEDKLKITELDIIYKESDELAVKVVDTIRIPDINAVAATSETSIASIASLDLIVGKVQGVVNVGDEVRGDGIVGTPTVVAFVPTDPNNLPITSGTITLSSIQTIADSTVITVGEPEYYVYNYNSKKPYKTLPSSDIIRVYDKVPVKALSQELISNRVVYGNYQNKHNPPTSLNYNVLASSKSSFDLHGGTGIVTAIISSNSVEIGSLTGNIAIGSTVTSDTINGIVVVQSIVSSLITLTEDISVTIGDTLTFEASSNIENNTSIIEYPNSSLKGNRTYQIGAVLSDRFGRQSTTLLSNNLDVTTANGVNYSGSTIFVPYIKDNINPGEWVGNSIKVLFNETIGGTDNGLYNGDSTSIDYNPLGWYSLKIVVKQTEQEYYNVYLPGIMASYPEDSTLEIGKTSHAVLINDNINKIPRDLSEVGPSQKLFRSSVRLFGRVENSIEEITIGNPGQGNNQYYPDNSTDTVTTISTIKDMFDYSTTDLPEPNLFPQFYSLESNPLTARISTNKKIGQVATLNYNASSGAVALGGTSDLIRLVNVSGDEADIAVGDIVTGPGFPSDLKVDISGYTPGTAGITAVTAAATTSNTIEYAGGVTPLVGQLISGVGVPDGTVILELLSAPFRMVVSNIVSVNIGIDITTFNPSTLEVDSSVSVTQGDIVHINSAGNPSIQQLAVYETEPVTSLLDIFWETTTTGLISDINYLITNSTDSGGSGATGISQFNVDTFSESLWSTGLIPKVFPIINTGSIFLVDSFEQAIPSSNIDTPLSILSVLNGNGTNVQTSNPTGPYFQLIETSVGSYEYNIETALAYQEDVFYGDNANLYTFTINFTAVVNGLSSNFSKTISLGNEPPYIISGLEFAPPYTEPVLVEVNNTTTQDVITLGGANGSGHLTFDMFNPAPNSGQALNWDILTEENLSGTASTHFSIDQTGKITNDDYSDPTMAASKYIVNVELSDPSLSVTRDVVINTGIPVDIIEEWTFENTTSGQGSDIQTFLFIHIPGTILVQPNAGWFVYQRGTTSANGPWDNLISTVGSNQVIQVTTGNVDTATCYEWYQNQFQSADDIRTDMALTSSCLAAGIIQNWTWTKVTSPLNPDPINYSFELV